MLLTARSLSKDNGKAVVEVIACQACMLRREAVTCRSPREVACMRDCENPPPRQELIDVDHLISRIWLIEQHTMLLLLLRDMIRRMLCLLFTQPRV